jgi:hypothetical protein
MALKPTPQAEPSPEETLELHERFARLLDAGTKAAFAVTLAAFALYVSGILPGFVPLASLPELWRLPLADYLARSGAPTGWEWVRFIGHGDCLSYVGICLFALVIVLSSAGILPLLRRRREYLLAALAFAQILVLLAAASGLFAVAR